MDLGHSGEREEWLQMDSSRNVWNLALNSAFTTASRMLLNFRMEGSISTKMKNWMICLWVCFYLDGVSWKMWQGIGRFSWWHLSVPLLQDHMCVVLWCGSAIIRPILLIIYGYCFWKWPEWLRSLLALFCLPCLPLVANRVLGCMYMCVCTHEHRCRCDGESGAHRYISSLAHREAVQGLITQGLLDKFAECPREQGWTMMIMFWSW